MAGPYTPWVDEDVITAERLEAERLGLEAVEADLATKADDADLTAHTGDTANPHGVTAAQVGAYTTGQVDTALDGKVDVAGDTMTGLLTIGSGDAANMYSAGTTAQRLAVKRGTASSPDAILGPLIKSERTVSVLSSAFAPSDGGEQMASILGVASGTASNQVQPVGVYGAAKNAGTTKGSGGPAPDACGLYGAGRISAGGIGTGIGAFVIGRRDSDSGRANGLEVHAYNGGSATPYNPIGFQTSQAIWINAGGAADSSAGIVISNAFGRQFEVGLAFTAQVTGGLTGGIKSAAIRDDSHAPTTLLINGSHTYGIDMNGGTFSTAGIRAKGHVHFSDDNTWDIGASATANRPRHVYAGNSVRAGNHLAILHTEHSGGKLTLRSLTSAAVNPGANQGVLYFRDGTTAGTLRLVVRAGAAGAEYTIADNIPQS